MMWHAWLGATLTKAALPIAGAVAAVVLSLSVALWWTSNRLSDARDRLSMAQADTLTCIRANDSARDAIRELADAQDRNRAEREDALRRQQAAVARIEELERAQNERTTETIERVIRVADGDACAAAPIPDRLRDSARRY